MNLDESRKNLELVIEENFPNKFEPLMVCLSVHAQLNIENLTQPFALVLMGNPSTNKTTICDLVNALPKCYKSDKFTPKSFVSHSANSKKEDLAKVDLLPKIKHKTLITPELAPLFSGNDDDLTESFGILTRVLDGKGYETDSGVHGKRGYTGDYHFMMIGAVVDVPHKVWKLMGTIGNRVYFLRLVEEKLSASEQHSQIKDFLQGTPYNQRLTKCQEAIIQFWDNVEAQGQAIVWDTSKDDQEAINRIVSLATFLSSLRGVIPTWNTYDGSGSNYQYEMPTTEHPSRASSSLYNLARGHAVLFGRNYITKEDLKVIYRVVLSSASRERFALVCALIENDGQLTTAQFQESTNVSHGTALKNMQQLVILGIANEVEIDTATKPTKAIRLKDSLSWLLEKEAKQFLQIPTRQIQTTVDSNENL